MQFSAGLPAWSTNEMSWVESIFRSPLSHCEAPRLVHHWHHCRHVDLYFRWHELANAWDCSLARRSCTGTVPMGKLVFVSIHAKK